MLSLQVVEQSLGRVLVRYARLFVKEMAVLINGHGQSDQLGKSRWWRYSLAATPVQRLKARWNVLDSEKPS